MQTTYLGRTGGGILKSATVSLTQGGIADIFVKLPNGRTAVAGLGTRQSCYGGDVRDALVLQDLDGYDLAWMTLSPSALSKLEALRAQADKMARS